MERGGHRAVRAAYPIGTKPRLALALLLGTAARIADVVRLGRGHVRDGVIHMVQQKTGAQVTVPLTNAVVEAINAAAPSEHVVFLLNEHGRAFSAHAFSKWFVKQCRRAGLDKGLSAHGLRKAVCRRLADAQCTAHEIAAISGDLMGGAFGFCQPTAHRLASPCGDRPWSRPARRHCFATASEPSGGECAAIYVDQEHDVLGRAAASMASTTSLVTGIVICAPVFCCTMCTSAIPAMPHVQSDHIGAYARRCRVAAPARA